MNIRIIESALVFHSATNNVPWAPSAFTRSVLQAVKEILFFYCSVRRRVDKRMDRPIDKRMDWSIDRRMDR